MLLIKFKISFVIIFCVFNQIVFSQDFTIKHFPPQFQGLSANCNEMIQDINGYLWISTDDGLCRFDGEVFKLYTTTEGLKRHEVTSIAEGNNGEIFVFTRGGVSLIKDFKPVNSELDDLPFFGKKKIINVYYDKKSDFIYLVSDKENQLHKYDNINNVLHQNINNCILRKIDIDSTTFIITKSFDSESLLSIKNNDTVVITSNADEIYDVLKLNEIIYALIDGELYEIKNQKIINKKFFINGFDAKIELIEVVKDAIYFVSKNILYYYNGLAVKKVLNGSNFTRIKSLFVDNENNLWVCTDNGILKINISPFNGYDSKNHLYGVPTKIHRDRQEKLWVSTLDGLFYKYDTSSFFNQVLNDRVYNFTILNNDNILFSSIKNGKYYLGKFNQNLNKSNKFLMKSEKIGNRTLQYINQKIITSEFSFSRDLKDNVLVVGLNNNLIINLDSNLQLTEFFDEKRLGKEDWIPSLFCHSNGDLWFRSSSGAKRIRNSKVKNFKLDKNGFYGFIEDESGNLIAVSDVGLTYIYLDKGDIKNYKHFNKTNGLSENSIYTFSYLNNKDLLLGTSRGLNKIIDFTDSLNAQKLDVKFFDKKDGLIGVDFYKNASFLDKDSSVWMGTSEGLIHYFPKKDVSNKVPPNLFLEEIKFQNTSQKSWSLINGDFDKIKNVNTPFFYHYQNDLTFDVKAISTSNPKMLKYSYYLEGAEPKWNEPTTSSFSRYTNLAPGNYVFKCKAIRTSDGVESKILTYPFKIDSPFYYKTWFYILIISGFGLLIYLFVYVREKQLKQINKSLERRVVYRTKQLDDEKKTVEKQNELITKSISYAKRIQYSILPKVELMDAFFTDHFIYYKPKDIVGGDFYWFRSFDDLAVIAAVDCTGHGVPGGFMTMMGSLLLDKIVHKTNLDTSKILYDLNSEIIRVLRQEYEGSMQDGMDLSICLIDKKKSEIHFSGARNGVYVFENNVAKHYEADLIPVGGFHSKKSKELHREYSQQKISINKDSWVFMYTDGYIDQLGGDKMRSMGMKLFEVAIKEAISLSSKKSREELLQMKYDNWRKNIPPIDDVLLIGFKI